VAATTITVESADRAASGPASPIIRIQDVSVEYGASGKALKKILNRVSVDIRAGEFISIVGQTGCGKSTLLRLVLAEEMPCSGRVLVDGSSRTQPDRRCGYVPQKYSLFPDRTVLENITFGLEVTEIGWFGGLAPSLRARRRGFREDALNYLRRMGLRESDGGKYPHQLSGGMQQRVAIAQALIMQPRILLLDEAFSALDPGTRQGMQRLIKDLWRETRTTILFVTHNPREAVTLATRIIALGRNLGDEDGAGVVLDVAVPEAADEHTVAGLIGRIELSTFPAGMQDAQPDSAEG
jgi:NitT/TauT family transport system ATP-binding protein